MHNLQVKVLTFKIIQTLQNKRAEQKMVQMVERCGIKPVFAKQNGFIQSQSTSIIMPNDVHLKMYPQSSLSTGVKSRTTAVDIEEK